MTAFQLLKDVAEGYRLSEEEAVRLLRARDRSLFEILAAADRVREERAGPMVSYELCPEPEYPYHKYL